MSSPLFSFFFSFFFPGAELKVRDLFPAIHVGTVQEDLSPGWVR